MKLRVIINAPGTTQLIDLEEGTSVKAAVICARENAAAHVMPANWRVVDAEDGMEMASGCAA